MAFLHIFLFYLIFFTFFRFLMWTLSWAKGKAFSVWNNTSHQSAWKGIFFFQLVEISWVMQTWVLKTILLANGPLQTQLSLLSNIWCDNTSWSLSFSITHEFEFWTKIAPNEGKKNNDFLKLIFKMIFFYCHIGIIWLKKLKI